MIIAAVLGDDAGLTMRYCVTLPIRFSDALEIPTKSEPFVGLIGVKGIGIFGEKAYSPIKWARHVLAGVALAPEGLQHPCNLRIDPCLSG